MTRDWKEEYVDRMGLIVALDGAERFRKLDALKASIKLLTPENQKAVQETIRLRFTPSNGGDGCHSAMASVKSVL